MTKKQNINYPNLVKKEYVIKLQTQIDELEARVSKLQAQVDAMHTPKEYEEYGKDKYEEGVAEATARCSRRARRNGINRKNSGATKN